MNRMPAGRGATVRSFVRCGAWVAVVALASAGCSGGDDTGAGSSRPDPTTDSGPPLDQWDAALAEVDEDGRATLEGALARFEVAYGGMPGATTPAGDQPDHILNGTPALRAVLAHDEELTPEQHARLDEVLADDPAPAGAAIEILPVAHSGVRQPRPPVTVDPAVRAKLEADANALRAEIAGYVGFDLPGPIVITFPSVQPKATLADSEGIWDNMSGANRGCRIRMFPSAVQKPNLLRSVVTHEIVHCFQAVVAGSSYESHRQPGWAVEGFATWAMSELDPAAPPVVTNRWRQWLTLPTTPLFKREYSAIGYFARVAESGVDPWSTFTATFAPGLTSEARVVASQGTSAGVLDTWASGLVRRPELGPEWDSHGSHITSDAYLPASLSVSETPRTVSANRYAAAVFAVTVITDVLDIKVEGHGRLADGNVETASLSSAWFCTRDGGCVCPDTPESEQVPPAPLNPVGSLLALTGGPTGTRATLRGLTLDEYCQTRPSTPTGPRTIHLKTEDACALLPTSEIERLAGAPLPVVIPQTVDGAYIFQAFEEFVEQGGGVDAPQNLGLAGSVSSCIHQSDDGTVAISVSVLTLTQGALPGKELFLQLGNIQDISDQIGIDAVLEISSRGRMMLSLLVDSTHFVQLIGGKLGVPDNGQSILIAAAKRIVELSS